MLPLRVGIKSVNRIKMIKRHLGEKGERASKVKAYRTLYSVDGGRRDRREVTTLFLSHSRAEKASEQKVAEGRISPILVGQSPL